MNSKLNANTVYIRKNENVDFDRKKLEQLFKSFHPSEIILSSNDVQEEEEEEEDHIEKETEELTAKKKKKKKEEETMIIGYLIFNEIEDAEMTFALFHHDQLELEYNSLSVMRYAKDLYTCYIKHIPSYMFDKISVDLYKLFRKYGPIHKCQILTKDTTIVQYYSFKNCDRAVNELDDTNFPGFPDIKMSVSTVMTKNSKTRKKRPSNLKLKYPTRSLSEPSSVNHTSSAATPASFRSYHYSPSTRPSTNLEYPVFELKPTMDLCNLYIKGLDKDQTNSDLFNLFSPFGRIISARVMPGNGGLRNFGFVSFSHPTEAAKAIIELYKSSSMDVRFHEPKHHRPEQDFSQQLSLLLNSTLGRHFYTTATYNNTSYPKSSSPPPPVPPLPTLIPAYQTQPYVTYYVPIITQPILADNNVVYQQPHHYSTPTSNYYYYQPCEIISDQPRQDSFIRPNRDRRPFTKNK